MKIQQILTIWFPAVLAVAYIIFLVLLSLDVFDMNASLLEKIGGFLIQNIPTAILVVALFLAWKEPMAGGIIFIIMGVLFTLFYGTYRRWDTFVLLSFPLLLIGVLFLLNKEKTGREKADLL